MQLQEFLRRWRGPIEDVLQQGLDSPDPALRRHYGMMKYHMGWQDADMQPRVRSAGKRLRPTLVLLMRAALGQDPQPALPAAGSVEILHNYSLMHDDIEDMDEMRRHFPTVWKVWGNGLAINAGDGMFSCAFSAMLGLQEAGFSAELAQRCMGLLCRACIQLTEGQFLDLDYESREHLTLAEYFLMVRKKTAALFATCLEVGALLSGCDSQVSLLSAQLGEQFGIAYQMQDDLANLWGHTDTTGKDACKDIAQRKKSLPIVIAMGDEHAGETMRSLYRRGPQQDIRQPVLDLLDEQCVRERGFIILGQRRERVRGLVTELGNALSQRKNAQPELLGDYLDMLLPHPE